MVDALSPDLRDPPASRARSRRWIAA